MGQSGKDISFRIMIAAVLLSVVAESSVGAADFGNKNSRSVNATRRYEVMTALSRFLYGIQHQIPGLLVSVYRPGEDVSAGRSAKAVGAAIRNDVRLFCEDVEGPAGQPLVYMFKPKIRFSGNDATISCVLAWNIVNSKTKARMHLITREKLRLRKIGDAYVICDARSTPVVFKHAGDERALKREYTRLVASGGLF